MNIYRLDRHLFCVTLIAGALTFAHAVPAFSAPADEINRAVTTAGAPDPKKADAQTFIKGFTSVVARARQKEVPSYVSAAVSMRPDLAGQIVVAAIRVSRPSDGKVVLDKQLPAPGEGPCEWVEPIIRAAIAAAPDEKDAIVRAAIAADPWAKECVLAAAGMKSETETAFFRPPGVDAGNINSTTFGTINPANIGGGGSGNVQSPSHP